MQKFDEKTNNLIDEKVQEYIFKYIKELQRHFDMSDKKMSIILHKVYKDLTPSFLRIYIKKIQSVLKSFYSGKIKRD